MSAYGQFCPVAKAMEVLDERWTLLVVRELLAGSTRFNELRRGNPKMSPALLSKRLRTSSAPGVVRRERTAGTRRTPSRPAARSCGRWSRRSGRGASAGSASSARRTSTRTC